MSCICHAEFQVDELYALNSLTILETITIINETPLVRNTWLALVNQIFFHITPILFLPMCYIIYELLLFMSTHIFLSTIHINSHLFNYNTVYLVPNLSAPFNHSSIPNPITIWYGKCPLRFAVLSVCKLQTKLWSIFPCK